MPPPVRPLVRVHHSRRLLRLGILLLLHIRIHHTRRPHARGGDRLHVVALLLLAAHCLRTTDRHQAPGALTDLPSYLHDACPDLVACDIRDRSIDLLMV